VAVVSGGNIAPEDFARLLTAAATAETAAT